MPNLRRIIEPLELFGVESFGDSAVVVKARLKTQPIERASNGRPRRRLRRTSLEPVHHSLIDSKTAEAKVGFLQAIAEFQRPCR